MYGGLHIVDNPEAAAYAGVIHQLRLAMKYRSLGRTGMKVSPYCLGAMMFGAMGNPDREETTRIIHKALDDGINFIDTS